MYTQDKKAIGLRIRKRREFLGLTREKFAERLGLSLGFVSEIERGEATMSIETMMTISEAVKLSPNEILLDGIINDDGKDIEEIVSTLRNCEPLKREYAMKLLKLYMVSCDWR